MEYSNEQLLNYVNRIKLSQQQKSSFVNQIDNLKEKATKAINKMDNTKVTNVKRAGSWKKGTALAPNASQSIDIDMVFFLDVDDNLSFDAQELRDDIIEVLCEAYPNKHKSDFNSGQKTIGIVFRSSGLEVDIVPFIPERGNTTYGRQPRKKLNSGEFKTSVDKQLEFIRKIKIKYPNFKHVVRILKSWKNYKELELSSFSIELVVAYLISTGGISGSSINEAIINFFVFLRKDKALQVYFTDAIGKKSSTSPWIADPTNNENNTIQMTNYEWEEVVEMAENSFETISYALIVQEKYLTLNLWREVFGPSFNIEEQN